MRENAPEKKEKKESRLFVYSKKGSIFAARIIMRIIINKIER